MASNIEGRKIMLYQGLENNLPILDKGEPAFTYDAQGRNGKLWVGTEHGNQVLQGLTTVIDSLSSISTTEALSANMGKTLKEMIDNIANNGSTGGGGKTEAKTYSLETTEVDQKEWDIPSSAYDPQKDSVIVFHNGVYLAPDSYTITVTKITVPDNPISDIDNNNLVLVVLKNIPDYTTTISGTLLTTDSVGLDKLTDEVRDAINAGGVEVIDNLTTPNSLKALSANQGVVLKQETDKAWKKGVYNDTDITNLGNHTAEKVLLVNTTDWKATGNVEQLDIIIPVGGSFSGLIKATYTTFWDGSDSHGGATVLYRLGNYTNGGTKLNDYVLETITPAFAKDYYIHQPYVDVNNGTVLLLLSKAPSANNPLIAKIEFQGYNIGQKNAFQIMNETNFAIYDNGSPTHNGYPWTPQTSNIPTTGDIGVWNSVAYRLKPSCEIVSDWNTILENGFYMTAPSENTHAPDNSSWWMGTVIRHDALHVIQKVNCVTNDREFQRRMNGGNWGAWIETSPMTLFQSVSDGKTKVASAISDKGVYTSPVETFDNMANNIRLIQTTKVVEGTFYLNIIPPRSASGDYVTPLMDFEPMQGTNRWGGVCLFNGSEIWSGIDSYSAEVHGLRMIKEQVGNQWQVRMRFFNGNTYATNQNDSVQYRFTN